MCEVVTELHTLLCFETVTLFIRNKVIKIISDRNFQAGIF